MTDTPDGGPKEAPGLLKSSDAETPPKDLAGKPAQSASLNLAGAPLTEPQPAPVEKLPPVVKAGKDLTEWVLVIMSGFLFLSMLSLGVGDFVAGKRAREDLRALKIPCAIVTVPQPSKTDSTIATTNALPAAGKPATLQIQAKPDSDSLPRGSGFAETCNLDSAALSSVLGHVEKEMSGFRTLWLEFTKIVLLNILLPVLTALLGYTFATGRKE
jgi:hypothetical protein